VLVDDVGGDLQGHSAIRVLLRVFPERRPGDVKVLGRGDGVDKDDRNAAFDPSSEVACPSGSGPSAGIRTKGPEPDLIVSIQRKDATDVPIAVEHVEVIVVPVAALAVECTPLVRHGRRRNRNGHQAPLGASREAAAQNLVHQIGRAPRRRGQALGARVAQYRRSAMHSSRNA
jgi:hypothetical protein